MPLFTVTPLPGADIPWVDAPGPSLATTANVASILSLIVAWRAFYLYKREVINGNADGRTAALLTEI